MARTRTVEELTGLTDTVDLQEPVVDATVAASLLIGLLLAVLARYGRQLWLLTWSIGLILCSVAYGVWRWLY